MRKKIVAGNWKMNCDRLQTKTLLEHIKSQEIAADVSVIVAPPFTNLEMASAVLKDSTITVAAQNMHQATHGAFTGEVCAAMLKSINIDMVVLGHSERRAMFWETNEILAAKVNTALENDMKIIFCFGEELEDRQKGDHFNMVQQQLEEGIFHISADKWENIILAYEPVWAIGTGETASPEQVQEMHQYVRGLVQDTAGENVANNVSVLYGGSVKPNNASEIFSKQDVDGGLIGGASLKAADFTAIINAFS